MFAANTELSPWSMINDAIESHYQAVVPELQNLHCIACLPRLLSLQTHACLPQLLIMCVRACVQALWSTYSSVMSFSLLRLHSRAHNTTSESMLYSGLDTTSEFFSLRMRPNTRGSRFHWLLPAL